MTRRKYAELAFTAVGWALLLSMFSVREQALSLLAFVIGYAARGEFADQERAP